MRRALLPLAALFLAAVPLGLRPAVASAAPTCFGKPATHVMQPGEGTFYGTAGNDVVVGSDGNDTINTTSSPAVPGGVDLVCGGGGDDLISVSGAGSKADGGAGRDRVRGRRGALARGGSGDDYEVSTFGEGGRAEGGSGDDSVEAETEAVGDGGSGDDFVVSDDSEVGAAALYGGSGSDSVENLGGTTLVKIDCGSAYDLAITGGATDVRRCEVVL